MDYRELREVMKFLHCKGLMPKDIYTDMCETLGDSAPSYAMVKKWVTEFRKGRTSTEDSGRSGRPRDVSTYENVDYIRQLIKDDERITVQDIAKNVGISFGSVHAILSKLLEMVKVSGRWVPRRVSNELKMARLEFCKEISACYRVCPDRLVHQTVIDDAWIYHFERTEILFQAPGQGGDLENGDDEPPAPGILNRVLTGELNPKDSAKQLQTAGKIDITRLPIIKSEANNEEVTSTSSVLGVNLKQETTNGDVHVIQIESSEPKVTTNAPPPNDCEVQNVKVESTAPEIGPEARNGSDVDSAHVPSSKSASANGSASHVLKVETIEPRDKPKPVNGSEDEMANTKSTDREYEIKSDTNEVNTSLPSSTGDQPKASTNSVESSNLKHELAEPKVSNGAAVPNILALLGQRPANGSLSSYSPVIPLMGPHSLTLGQLSGTQLANLTLLSHLATPNAMMSPYAISLGSSGGIKRSVPEQSAPPKKKLRSSRPPSETSCVFWDSGGVIFVETLEPGKKLTGELYSKMLERLKTKLCSKRPGALEHGVLLVEDQALTGVKPSRGLQLLPVPPNSPDLSPSDFHIFPKVKEHLRGRQVAEEGLMSIIAEFFKTQDAGFFKYGLGEMERRCTLCADLNGDHVDK